MGKIEGLELLPVDISLHPMPRLLSGLIFLQVSDQCRMLEYKGFASINYSIFGQVKWCRFKPSSVFFFQCCLLFFSLQSLTAIASVLGNNLCSLLSNNIQLEEKYL